MRSVQRGKGRWSIAVLIAGWMCAAGSVACTSTSAGTSVVTPTAEKCGITASSSPSSFQSDGGKGSITVSTERDCTWSAAANVSWVTLDTKSGQGEAVVSYAVAANPSPAGRSFAIVVGTQTLQIAQAGAPCRFDLSRSGDSIGASGGALSFSISTLSGCSWSASSAVPWISVTSPGSGNASATIGLTVTANTGARRVGTVNVAEQTFTVTQDARATQPPPPPPVPAPTASLTPAATTIQAGQSVTLTYATTNATSATLNGAPVALPSGTVTVNPTATTTYTLVATNATGSSSKVATVTVTSPPPPVVTFDAQVSSVSGSCPTVTFVAGGTTVVVDKSTDFQKMDCAALKKGLDVTVTGVRQTNGVVQASLVRKN